MDNPSLESSLKGARILIVEDELLVSLHLEGMMREFGCEVVGPATGVKKGVALATTEQIDGALLDLNVAGQVVYSVAQVLRDRDIPFAFVTGYAAEWISDSYREQPALQKPIQVDKLRDLLGAMLSWRAH